MTFATNEVFITATNNQIELKVNQPNQEYKFTVAEEFQFLSGNQYSEESAEVVAWTRHSPVKGIQITDWTVSSLKVDWTSKGSGVDYKVLCTGANGTTIDTNQTSVVIEGLSPLTEYKVDVLAQNEAGWSAENSQKASVVTLPSPPEIVAIGTLSPFVIPINIT